MKLFMLALSAILSSSLYANLVEEVDQLSPDEAHHVMAKIRTKSMESMRFTFSVTAGSVISYPHEFNNSLPAGQDTFRSFPSISANFLWKVTPHYLLGFIIGGMGAGENKQIAPNVFQSVRVSGMDIMLASGYVFEPCSHSRLVPIIGLGVFTAGARLITSNDIAQSTYNYNYSGTGMAGQVGLQYLVKLNELWGIGADIAYFYARVNGPQRSGLVTVGSPQNIEFNGGKVGAVLSFNL